MRSFRRSDRRFASAFVIRSPVYSAILRARLKETTEKHPLPSIGDFLIARPGASLSFILFGIVTQTD